MGDLYGYINQNIFDVKHGGVKGTSNSLYYNDSISITMLDFSITSIELLMEESKKLGVNYLIIDNKFDNRYPIFDNIFKNEEKYLYLEKVFEYDSEKIDLKIKIFKINFEKYHKLQ